MKWARTVRKLSQKQLAERAGVSTGMIGNLESGARERPRELVAIARALSVKVGWLDTGEGDWDATVRYDSAIEEMFATLASDWDVEVIRLHRHDAQRLPSWLVAGMGEGRTYVPDFEMHVPTRSTPVWIECKGRAAFLGQLIDKPFFELERTHPEEFAVFYPEPSKLFNGIAELMQRFGARPKGDVATFKASESVADDFDTPAFSRSIKSAETSYTGPGIPVVGTAKLGDDGHFCELEHPVGHGDGRIELSSRDANAYAVRCKGDSMKPRIKHGEFVIVEPNHSVSPGDEVLVKAKDGQVMVKELAYIRDGRAYLTSVNEAHPRISFGLDEIEAMHYVAGIAKSALWKQEPDAP